MGQREKSPMGWGGGWIRDVLTLKGFKWRRSRDLRSEGSRRKASRGTRCGSKEVNWRQEKFSL